MALTQVQGGMILASGQSIPKAALPTGSVLQVVNATKTDSATINSTTFASLISASITPTSSTSKILVVANISFGGWNSTPCFRLNRGGTNILLSDSSGSRTQTTYGTHWSASNVLDFVQNLTLSASMNYLDSPATTSSTTYAVYWADLNGQTSYCNRSYGDANASWSPRSTSSIVLMEIAA